jgi:hypothetical protein
VFGNDQTVFADTTTIEVVKIYYVTSTCSGGKMNVDRETLKTQATRKP